MWIFQDGLRQKTVANMEAIVKQDGYPLEKYEVTTKDGYINTVYRIRHGKNGDNNNRSRPPVLLAHGMICNSSMFVNENCLAYYLAENGFDVWLPNHRGTNFSRRHVEFDPENEKEKYWSFSLHELGVYDMTAFIDLVLDHTEHEKVSYIGFSQGCTVMAIMGAEVPDYNEKISVSLFFGIPILFDNCPFFPTKFNIYWFTFGCQVIENIFRTPVYELTMIKWMRLLMAYAEKNTLVRKILEIFSWNILGHKDFEQLQEVDFPKLSLTCPDTSSIKQVLHFSQNIKGSRFARYDYGTKKNMKLYGTKIPPKYDLSKVTAPVIIFYGKNDMYNNYRKDKMSEKMGNIVHEHIINYDFYNHVDFLFARDNIDLVYSHAVEYLKKFCTNKNKNN